MAHHASLTDSMPIPEVKALFAQPPGPWPSGWEGMPNVCQSFREMFDAASRNLPPPPRWEADRGIVICAGGWRFFASLYVTVRMIRHVGCNLPIQVWYLGDRGEFDPRMQAALADHGVGWINGNAFARDRGLKRRILGGWELKPFAAAYCPYREVISLDADCYPAYNPEEFMAQPEFQRVGAAFWPDQGKLEPGQWERFGIPYHDEPAWESGQFIVDKGRHWNPLALTIWLNDHSDFVYHHVYGDKDTFHLAWRKLGYEVCVPTSSPGWHIVAFLQRDFSGNPPPCFERLYRGSLETPESSQRPQTSLRKTLGVEVEPFQGFDGRILIGGRCPYFRRLSLAMLRANVNDDGNLRSADLAERR